MNRLRDWCRRRMTKDNLMILALAGVLLMVIALPEKTRESSEGIPDLLSGREEPSGGAEGGADPAGSEEGWLYREETLARRLEAFLSHMDGVGQVRVMLTLSASEERVVEKDVPAQNTQTEEEDAAGGRRSVRSENAEEDTVYTSDGSGEKVPYVKKILAARVEGVTVLAQGGDSWEVRKDITDVIESLFGVEAHKIKVAKMGTVSQ